MCVDRKKQGRPKKQTDFGKKKVIHSYLYMGKRRINCLKEISSSIDCRIHSIFFRKESVSKQSISSNCPQGKTKKEAVKPNGNFFVLYFLNGKDGE